MLNWLIKPILDWLLGKLLAAIEVYERDKKAHQSAVNQAAQDTQKAKELKPDATAKETDDSIDDMFKHI
jgi:hypothetical protein